MEKKNTGWHHSHECALTNMETMLLSSTGLGLSENMPLMSNRPLFFLGFVFWVSHLEPPVNSGCDYALTVVNYGRTGHIIYIQLLTMHTPGEISWHPLTGAIA
jgi:hypothetical protein